MLEHAFPCVHPPIASDSDQNSAATGAAVSCSGVPGGERTADRRAVGQNPVTGLSPPYFQLEHPSQFASMLRHVFSRRR